MLSEPGSGKLLRNLIMKDKLPRNLVRRKLWSRPFWAQRLILRNRQRGYQAS